MVKIVMCISLFIVSVGLSACQTTAPVAWEHGWKTKHVVATRYRNPMMGYNIGFDFPLNPNDCDRDELVQFVKKYNGYPWEMGGYPGATMYVVFKDVKDKDAANRKLKEILPPMEKLVASF